MLIAYCYASGQIHFGRSVPGGAIEIARGYAAAVRRLIYGTTRLARDNRTWLVPGVPEADTEEGALIALKGYLDWIRKHPRDGVSISWITEGNGTGPAGSHDKGNAAQLAASAGNTGNQEPGNPEVREVLGRWRGTLPVEVVGLILGLDARLQEMRS